MSGYGHVSNAAQCGGANMEQCGLPRVCDRLTPLIRKTQPYAKRIAHEGIWVEPELMAEIGYRAKSAEGKVRHPFFKGLREDLRCNGARPALQYPGRGLRLSF